MKNSPVLLCIGGFFLTNVIVVVVFFSPLVSQWLQQQHRFSEHSKQYTHLKKIEHELQDYSKYQKLYTVSNNMFIHENKQHLSKSDIKIYCHELAKQVGVDNIYPQIANTNSRKKKRVASDFVKSTYEISGVFTYDQLLEYLKRLTQESHFIVVKNLDVSAKSESQMRYLDVQMTVQFFAIVNDKRKKSRSRHELRTKQ